MEEEKLLNQIKSAVENAEPKEFPGMEKVWQRVEEKLDNKEDKKAMLLWKKVAVAACLLLMGTLGFEFMRNDEPKINTDEVVTVADTIKKTNPENAVVTSEPLNPVIKEDAVQILQKQITPQTQVAVETTTGTYTQESLDVFKKPTPTTEGYFSTPDIIVTEDHKSDTKKEKTHDVEMFVDKRGKVSNARVEEPLVLINDQVEKKSIKEIDFDASDSLVVLKEPLYIINGTEYTEQEVFGPNPTSPYTPLNKQEIETISVLQNEKAVEVYGKKGQKGVVIITTKNGKPVSASKKAK